MFLWMLILNRFSFTHKFEYPLNDKPAAKNILGIICRLFIGRWISGNGCKRTEKKSFFLPKIEILILTNLIIMPIEPG